MTKRMWQFSYHDGNLPSNYILMTKRMWQVSSETRYVIATTITIMQLYSIFLYVCSCRAVASTWKLVRT